MSESIQERVARLLSEGLDYYGMYETTKAIIAWQEALELDPSNEDARDYLSAADRRNVPRDRDSKGSVGDRKAESTLESMTKAARDLIRQGSYDEALDVLRASSAADLFNIDIESTIELVRSRLIKQYREKVGDTTAIPMLRADAAAIRTFNLPSDAGFMLSLVDGATSVADVISLSGMDDFESMRILQGLLEAGIVEIRE